MSNIINDKTIEQYNSIYKSNNNLRKIHKYEVENTPILIKKGNWWLINDIYYEAPKCKIVAWYKNLKVQYKVGLCVLTVGVIATAIIVPILETSVFPVVNETEWRHALDVITEPDVKRNFTFTGEFDVGYKTNGNSEPDRIREKVYVVNNEEHVIRTLIESGKEVGTSESCYKFIYPNEYHIKDKANGVWSDYQYDIHTYGLPSYEIKELSMFKIMYEDFKFSKGVYTYTQEASEELPEITTTLKFRKKNLVSMNIKYGDRNNYRKFNFFNYNKTNLSL